jgi:hypothetical protein
MGKASRRKAQRRQGIGQSRTELEKARVLRKVQAGLTRWQDRWRAEKEAVALARSQWLEGVQHEAAVVPTWPEGSAGARFANQMREYAEAPRLATAVIPSPEAFAADSAHWAVAADALVRAMVFDDVAVSDPVVQTVLDRLVPGAEAEAAYHAIWDAGGEADDELRVEARGPIMKLATLALIDATWSALGLARVDDFMAALEPRLDAELSVAGVKSLTGRDVATAMIRGYAHHYRLEQPGDDEALERIGDTELGNALDVVRASKLVGLRESLLIGLVALRALACLCQTTSEFIGGEARVPQHAPSDIER